MGEFETDLVDLNEVLAATLDDASDLVGNLAVHTAGQSVESKSVDARTEIHTVLEGLDCAGGRSGGSGEGSLSVLDSEQELGLSSEISLVGGRGGDGEGKGDLGLLGELLGEVSDELEGGKGVSEWSR